MSDGVLWTAGFLGWGILIVILAYRSGLIDRWAHRISDPPQREQPRHLRIVRNGPPSPLSRRDQGDCGLYDYRGGDDAA